MKKYTKVASFFLFAALAVFVLFQYQNCGGNNNNVSWSAVGVSGLSYLVTLTPSAATATRGQAFGISTNVQVSGPETLIVRTGYILNGNKQQVCEVPTQGPVTNTGNLPCFPQFSQSGPVQLYVDVIDPNFGPNVPMLTCTNPPIAGCVGTYTITVQ